MSPGRAPLDRVTPVLPTNPAHLAAGSALAGAVWGLWQGRTRSAPPPPAESPAERDEDGPAS